MLGRSDSKNKLVISNQHVVDMLGKDSPRVGTYNNETGLTSSVECKPCPGGHYCDSLGMTTSSGVCQAGYFCEYGVDRADPSGNGTCVGPG